MSRQRRCLVLLQCGIKVIFSSFASEPFSDRNVEQSAGNEKEEKERHFKMKDNVAALR